MIKYIRLLLARLSPKSFNSGLNECNAYAKSLVKNRKPKKVLDLGCQDGRFTMEFFGDLGKPTIVGLEYVSEDLQKARKKGIVGYKTDLNEPWKLKSNQFDIILSSQNIEHMHNTRLYLEECYRCLKPGGQLILMTENLAAWVNIFSLVMGWQPFSTTAVNGWNVGNPLTWHLDNPIRQEFHEKYRDTLVSGVTGHVRVMSYVGLADILQKVGFRRVGVYTRGYLPFAGVLSGILTALDPRHGYFLIGTGFKAK